MSGTIRLRNIYQEGKDVPIENQTVTDSEGFTWHLAPNESKVLTNDANQLTLASNATVVWGTATRQAKSLDIVADIAEQPAVT